MPHTPGPWMISPNPSERGRHDVLTTEHGDSGPIVAQAAFRGDAALIAAAPELLDVAEMVNYTIQKWRERGQEPPYHAWLSIQDAAQAAIAKAEGRE